MKNQTEQTQGERNGEWRGEGSRCVFHQRQGLSVCVCEEL